MGTLAAALVGLRNRKTVGELKRFRQTSALRTRVGIPMWSADRAGFPDCKTTQPRLRGALYVWFTSNTSTQQLGHSFVEPKFVFRFLLRFQKCSCFTAYLGHDERTNSLKLKAMSRLVFGDCLHNHREPCEFASGVCHWQTKID